MAEHFASLEDPRVERTKLHPLLSIVVIALCAVICGAETWNEIAEFGEAKSGRLEVRRHWVLCDPDTLAWLQEAHHWPGLRALAPN